MTQLEEAGTNFLKKKKKEKDTDTFKKLNETTNTSKYKTHFWEIPKHQDLLKLFQVWLFVSLPLN